MTLRLQCHPTKTHRMWILPVRCPSLGNAACGVRTPGVCRFVRKADGSVGTSTPSVWKTLGRARDRRVLAIIIYIQKKIGF